MFVPLLYRRYLENMPLEMMFYGERGTGWATELSSIRHTTTLIISLDRQFSWGHHYLLGLCCLVAGGPSCIRENSERGAVIMVALLVGF